MKVTRILFGLGVGAAAGFAVALRNRDDHSVNIIRLMLANPLLHNQNLNVKLRI